MIYIIYTDEQYEDAEEILHFLVEEKKIPMSSCNENCYELLEDDRIAQEAAIILLSNVAVMDGRWQTLVRDIPEGVRLIPVSSTRNADYTDPEMVPKKIREVNYIRMDGRQHENIWDSLTTETGFYDIKNRLLLNKNIWLFSKCLDDFLLSDGKKINEYLLLFYKKAKEERNPFFQDELSEIIHYLEVSRRYSKRLLRKKVLDYVRRAGAVIVVIVYFIIFRKMGDFTDHLKYADTIISAGTHGEVAPINAVKLVDGLTNPLISDSAKIELYNKLSEHLDMNWHNTPIGLNYIWALNDAQIAADEQYIWSANGDGGVAKWDTYTGGIVWKEEVSEQPLSALAVSEKEDLFVALDSDGYVYKKYDGQVWEKSEKSYDIPFYARTKLTCNGEKNTAAAAGENGKLFYFGLEQGVTLLWEGQYDKVFCLEINGERLEAIVQKEDILFDLCIGGDGVMDETPIPVKWDSACAMDIQNGTVLMADQKYQVVTWSKEEPEEVNPLGIVLSKPVCLRFLNDQMIAYNDRNLGTHLYDLRRKLDLGSILGDAAAVTSLSASSDTVMAYLRGDGVCCSENIGSLLPMDYINEDEICAAYMEKGMSSDGMIRQVSIENEYIIRVVLSGEEEDSILIIDGGNRYYIGDAQRDFSLVEDDGANVFFYVDKPTYFTGKPTVVGIAGHGDVLLVGSSDGSFFETIFTGECSFQRGCHFQIPSHAAIEAVYQTEDCYYLKDITGTFWRARIGYDAVTPEGAVAAVKEKLHCAADNQIYEIVSKDTIENIEVKLLPGGGTEEWE